MTIADFCGLIIKEPHKAFPSGMGNEYPYSDDLINYLKIFFYERLEENAEISDLHFSDEDLRHLRVYSYCYLLGADGFQEDKLLNCLSIAQKENIINHITLDTIENYKEELNNLENPNEGATELLIHELFQSWETLESLVSIYYDELIKNYKQNNRKIQKIIVFEAPPFCGVTQLDHFYISGGTYLTCFTFEKAIKENINLDIEHEIKIPDQLWEFKLPFRQDRKKIYAKVNEKDKKVKKKEIIDNIIKGLKSNIVYIDLSMIPLPLTSDMRKNWSINEKYKINGKQLPVLLLEWSIEKLKKRFFTGDIIKPFNSKCQIAIGTPINTSVSIFEYFSDKMFEIDKDENINIKLATLNSAEEFKLKPYLQGHTIPLFKYNIVDNQTPTEKFVKNAFDI